MKDLQAPPEEGHPFLLVIDKQRVKENVEPLQAILLRAENNLSVGVYLVAGKPYTKDLLSLPGANVSQFHWHTHWSPVKHFTTRYIGSYMSLRDLIAERLPIQENIEVVGYKDLQIH